MNLLSRDPASMTSEERLREIAAILARGYLRLILTEKESRNSLAGRLESEAPCDRLVNGNEAVLVVEVAL